MLSAELIRLAAAQGLFALLFVAMLIYVVKANERREERLMNFVETVGPQLQATCDKLDAVTAIAGRIELKVDSCIPRGINAAQAEAALKRRAAVVAADLADTAEDAAELVVHTAEGVSAEKRRRVTI